MAFFAVADPVEAVAFFAVDLAAAFLAVLFFAVLFFAVAFLADFFAAAFLAGAGVSDVEPEDESLSSSFPRTRSSREMRLSRASRALLRTRSTFFSARSTSWPTRFWTALRLVST